MADRMLPKEFSDLEPFAAQWCLETETERFAARVNGDMADLQAFYDAAFPRTEAALEHCNQFPLDDMPADVVNLMRLLYSLINVSFAVECWKQPYIPDTGAADIVRMLEPNP